LLLISQLIKLGFKVEIEGTKCWLKYFDSNKVIVKVIKKGRLYKLLELFNPWLQNVASRLRGMVCDIKNSNMCLCKL